MKYKLVKRDVYLSEFKDMTFLQRYVYLVINNWWCLSLPHVNKNPAYWCFMDLFNIFRIVTGVIIVLPLLTIFLVPFDARDMKTRYEDMDPEDYIGVYFRNVYALDLKQ